MSRVGSALPTEDQERIVEMLRVGAVPSRIASVIGCKPEAIRTVAAQHGLIHEYTARRRKARLRTTPAMEKRIIAKLLAKTNHKQIAAEFGVSVWVVERVAQENQIRRQLAPELVERVAELLRGGVSNIDVVRETGVPYHQVTKVKRRFNIPRKPIRPVTTKELERARRLLEDGASYGEVNRTLNRVGSTIQRHLPGYGWDRNQVAEWNRIARLRPDDHSQDVFKIAFASSRARTLQVARG